MNALGKIERDHLCDLVDMRDVYRRAIGRVAGVLGQPDDGRPRYRRYVFSRFNTFDTPIDGVHNFDCKRLHYDVASIRRNAKLLVDTHFGLKDVEIQRGYIAAQQHVRAHGHDVARFNEIEELIDGFRRAWVFCTGVGVNIRPRNLLVAINLHYRDAVCKKAFNCLLPPRVIDRPYGGQPRDCASCYRGPRAEQRAEKPQPVTSRVARYPRDGVIHKRCEQGPAERHAQQKSHRDKGTRPLKSRFLHTARLRRSGSFVELANWNCTP